MRNLKKVIALVAVFAMLVSTVAFAQAFSDVAETDNYTEAIETLNTLGILTGDDENNDGVMEFRPEDTITRAETTAIISRIQGMGNAAQTTTEFTDVPSSHWASGYVAQAATQGIVNGYGDGTFGPDDNVTYEQIIKMLMETLGYYPFAIDNGGYPTGYLAAAQRYGVLDGVIGGGIGTEAKRGMVAQLVYNAIDTPLMDKYSYGKESEYVIYDGLTTLGSPYQSLLTRDLKLVKLTGVIEANSYTDNASGVTYSANEKATVMLNVDNTVDNRNYLSTTGAYSRVFNNDGDKTGEFLKVYQEELDADAFLGYAVSLYASIDAADNCHLVSIAKSEGNDSVSYTFDLYKDIIGDSNSGYKLEFYKDANSSSKDVKTIAKKATIIYNGIVAGKFDVVNDVNTYMGYVNDNNSGMVTLVDCKSDVGYDVVIIEAGVTAVVNQVSANGKVTFLNSVALPNGGGVSNLDFGDDDQLIKLTQNGEEFDYTTLEKWDIITINKYERDANVTFAEVLGADNYVDGYITSYKAATSDAPAEYRLNNGTWYKVAGGFYPSGTLKVGKSGRFYVDAYGKLAALDDDVVVEGAGSVSTGNYAYVINAKEEASTWDTSGFDVRVQILDKSGEIYEAYLAETVTFTNATAFSGIYTDLDKSGSATVNDFTSQKKNITKPLAQAIAAGLCNKLITYSANSAGEIKAITFAVSGDDDADFRVGKSAVNAEFDASTMTLEGGATVNEDTLVFFIDKAADGTAITIGGTAIANKTTSNVKTAAALADGEEYDYYSFDEDLGSGDAGVILVLNQAGSLSTKGNIAVISSVGKSSANGDTVYTVDFFMNGEFKSATTMVDMTGATAISGAVEGDVFDLTVAGDTITAASKILDFEESTAADAAPVITLNRSDDDNDLENVFGIVNKVNGSRITFAPYGSDVDTDNDGSVDAFVYDSNAPAAAKTAFEAHLVSKNIGEANVYVYDSNLKRNKIYVGSAGDIWVDTIISEGKYDITVDENIVAAKNNIALGILNSVYVKTVDNKVVDVVVYIPEEYKYKN